MSATIIRCPRCNAILGNAVGDFHLFMTMWSHRSYVVRGLSFLVCDVCSTEFSPRPVAERDRRSVERIVADSSARTFRCLTDGCGHILGQIGRDRETGKLVAITKAAKRVLVAESIVFVSCPSCRAGWEPPFDAMMDPPASVVSAVDEAAMTRPAATSPRVAAAAAGMPSPSSPLMLPRPVVPASRAVERMRPAERMVKAFGSGSGLTETATGGAKTGRPDTSFKW